MDELEDSILEMDLDRIKQSPKRDYLPFGVQYLEDPKLIINNIKYVPKI